MPRVAAFRNFVLHHIIHHRGQLSVYLRLNDVPVPAIYRPVGGRRLSMQPARIPPPAPGVNVRRSSATDSTFDRL